MCQLKSAIVLKDRVFMPLDTDKHEKMIKELKLDDTTNNPDFVRVEIVPKDGNLFNHDLDNWQFGVDQDFKPDWFSAKFAEEETKKELLIWFKERFIIDDRTWEKREGQRIYVRNSSVVARGNSSVVARGNSSVEAWGNSSVVARGNSSVVAWGNSSVVAWENSSVVAWGNSSVEAWGNSQILIPKDWSKKVKVKIIQDLSSVKDLRINKIFVANKDLKLAIFKPNKK